ncbi:hypothetical protein FRC01_008331 [Tulasnella sp. 417]|nr:hypothetical protein FRC01_008331 [Tulasnella sp. 417]
MDLHTVLASFTAPGPIKSRADLDKALDDLLLVIAMSREEIPLVLDILVRGTQGLLEAVLTSSDGHAFTFRARVLKALRTSLATSTPLAMEDLNAYKSATAELDSLGQADQNNANMGLFEPTSPTKPTKRETRHARANSINRFSSAKSVSESASHTKSSSWTGPTVISNLSKLLTKFLENFFASCVNSEIEEFASDNLLKTLTPCDPLVSGNAVPKDPTSADPSPNDSVPLVSPLRPEALSRLHYLSIKQEDIMKYLNHSSKPKSGNWPVRDIFLRTEKKIKQLSVGYFPPENQTKLLQKDFGIPIYTADLGDGLRLIYHVDFGAPTATGQESEVDVKLWGTVAAQLSRRGQEYIERCARLRVTMTYSVAN